MNAAQRAQLVYRVLARHAEALTLDEIEAELPGMRHRQLLDAMSKLFRDGVAVSDGPPVGTVGIRRYSAKATTHPNYQPEGGTE